MQVEPSESDLGSGWYLDRVEVIGPDGGVLRFPCHNWLGKSDAGDHRGAPGIQMLVLYVGLVWTAIMYWLTHI